MKKILFCYFLIFLLLLFIWKSFPVYAHDIKVDPNIIEEHNYFNYQIEHKYKSKFNETLLHYYKGIECPRCKLKQKDLIDKEIRKCKKCKLWMKLNGNNFYLSNKEIK